MEPRNTPKRAAAMKPMRGAGSAWLDQDDSGNYRGRRPAPKEHPAPATTPPSELEKTDPFHSFDLWVDNRRRTGAEALDLVKLPDYCRWLLEKRCPQWLKEWEPRAAKADEQYRADAEARAAGAKIDYPIASDSEGEDGMNITLLNESTVVLIHYIDSSGKGYFEPKERKCLSEGGHTSYMNWGSMDT